MELGQIGTRFVCHLKLEFGKLFELNLAVVLLGHYAGVFASLYIYVMKCLCFVILLTWKRVSEPVLNQHRHRRMVKYFAMIEAKLGCGFQQSGVTALQCIQTACK